MLLYITHVKKNIPLLPVQKSASDLITPVSPLKVTRDANNVLTIEFCDLLVGNELIRDMNSYNAADKVYKYYGFNNGSPWNTSVQFEKNIIDRDTFGLNTGFTATYHFNVEANFDYSVIKAVIERPYLWKVKVNETEVKAEDGQWWLDREFGVFNIGTLVKKGDNIISLIVSPMRVNAEIEPIYILGDFSVKPAEKGWNIEAPVKSLTEGSWKNQGMPFYSSGITYSRDYNIESPSGKYIVKLNKWNGTVAEVKVNGEPATLIAFPPYESNVTSLIRPGKNTIEVKVKGSLKNLLGPHFNNPAPGLVSPWLWRNVKSYPPGRDYQLLDYGLFDDFSLVRGI
jgi:hypothetical protein